MPGDSFRIRNNGLIELRFQFDKKTVSVYGRTKEECLKQKEEKIGKLLRAKACQEDERNSVLAACFRYCEIMQQDNKVHGEGYKTLVKTARFIGRHEIGRISIVDLSDEMIEQFRSDVSDYSVYTVRKAIFMLTNVKKGIELYGKKEKKSGLR